MSAHLPKTGALIAYADGLLSTDGIRRIEAHLADCGVCQTELSAIRAYAMVTGEIREAPAPAIDFDRMDLTLAREAKKLISQASADPATAERRSSTRPATAEPKSSAWLGAVGIAFAAAAVLMVVYWPEPPVPVAEVPQDAPVETPEPAPVVPAEAAALDARVTLAAGAVEVRPEGRALAPGRCAARGLLPSRRRGLRAPRASLGGHGLHRRRRQRTALASAAGRRGRARAGAGRDQQHRRATRREQLLRHPVRSVPRGGARNTIRGRLSGPGPLGHGRRGHRRRDGTGWRGAPVGGSRSLVQLGRSRHARRG